MALAEPKYSIGDSVVWINDYCTNLGLRTITGMEQDKWGWKYYVSSMDTPWSPIREKNLYFSGTEPKFNLVLNNGMSVFLVETDSNANRYYDVNGTKAVLIDGVLYSVDGDWDEPCDQLEMQFQPNTLIDN